ncbi:MAG: ABC transporter permease [Burkholderiales bacterium]|jgi:putative ABC transport system permease protein|nr:ABC transporter permease [Rhodocyclaceae bacterium]MCA3167266.1 ABC transporter permease [Burkholderiales bacterium]MCA6467327.1 ABC transporter permease [Chitinophagaceae bacterium]MCE2724901.1 ABC transporter permease [Betaproteobacteria bacterium]MCA3041752.1 ABC transporter permease [Rhodocyclaceae bacterium]
MMTESFRLALESIARNGIRASLTVLGVVIGVASVITMITLGRGATSAISNQISSLGSNLVIVQPGQRLGPGQESAGSAAFSIRDVQAIETQVYPLAGVAPVVARKITLVSGSKNWNSTVTGSTNAYLTVANWQLDSGRTFSERELLAGSAVCLVGATVQRELFADAVASNAEIRIGRFSCEVVGRFKKKGQTAGGNDQDDFILLPLRTVQRRIIGNDKVTAILVAAATADAVSSVKSQIENLLLERRNIEAGETANFTVQDTRQIADTLSSTTRVLTTLLGAVATVSLVVGGIGIMNIMLVSVTERTREIGIRLAIGAFQRDVLLQFLAEAVLLACFGGLAGVFLALLMSIALASATGIPFVFDLTINLLALGVAVVIGVAFGYLPARRAANMSPIDALAHHY